MLELLYAENTSSTAISAFTVLLEKQAAYQIILAQPQGQVDQGEGVNDLLVAVLTSVSLLNVGGGFQPGQLLIGHCVGLLLMALRGVAGCIDPCLLEETLLFTSQAIELLLLYTTQIILVTLLLIHTAVLTMLIENFTVRLLIVLRHVSGCV